MTITNPEHHAELFEPGRSAPISTYAKQLWKMRFYAQAQARGKLEAGHAENVLGRLWLFIEPTLFIGVYYVLFGILLDADRGVGSDFLAYLAVGKIAYGFLRRAINASASSLSSDQALNAPTSMPRAIYPLIGLMKSQLAYRYEIPVMLGFVLVRGISPRLSWVFTIPLGVMAFGFAFGASLILVRLISSFADLRSALPQVLLLGMYASGVIFPVEQYVIDLDNGTLLLRLMTLNPFYVFVKLNQWAVMGYRAPEMDWIIGSSLLWAFVLPVLGLWWFIRSERRYSSAIYAG